MILNRSVSAVWRVSRWPLVALGFPVAGLSPFGHRVMRGLGICGTLTKTLFLFVGLFWLISLASQAVFFNAFWGQVAVTALAVHIGAYCLFQVLRGLHVIGGVPVGHND